MSGAAPGVGSPDPWRGLSKSPESVLFEDWQTFAAAANGQPLVAASKGLGMSKGDQVGVDALAAPSRQGGPTPETCECAFRGETDPTGCNSAVAVASDIDVECIGCRCLFVGEAFCEPMAMLALCWGVAVKTRDQGEIGGVVETCQPQWNTRRLG